MTDLQDCLEAADIDQVAGRRVRVIGEYVEVDMRMRPKPPPQFQGLAAIRLRDATLVMLEPGWSPLAIRSSDERCLAGKQVIATGVLWATPPPPSDPVAFRVDPCLSPVDLVVPAEAPP